MIDSQALSSLVATTLDDYKAQDIVEMDISAVSSLTDRMIVCTATSGRHAKSLADKAWVAAKEAGVTPIGQEGDDVSGWFLLDLDAVIVHIMLADKRDYYQIEDLWKLTPGESDAA